MANNNPKIDLEKMIDKMRSRADFEYDMFVNTGVKINNSLLLINSAVIAILVSLNGHALFKPAIFFLVTSAIFSLISLYFQKELSRDASIKFRLAAIQAEESFRKNEIIAKDNLPDTATFRSKASRISMLINFSLLFLRLG